MKILNAMWFTDMGNPNSKGILPTTSVIIISVLFTPVVGGILSGFNAERFGQHSKSRRMYCYSILLALDYAIFLANYLPPVLMPFGHPLHTVVFTMLFFPVIGLPVIVLRNPPTFLLFILLPSIIMMMNIYRHQRSLRRLASLGERGMRWYDAYLLAIPVTIALGIFVLLCSLVLHVTSLGCDIQDLLGFLELEGLCM
jgi:hypothetical protein